MHSITVFLTMTFFFCIAMAMALQPDKHKFYALRHKAADTSLAIEKCNESQASSLGTILGNIPWNYFGQCHWQQWGHHQRQFCRALYWQWHLNWPLIFCGGHFQFDEEPPGEYHVNVYTQRRTFGEPPFNVYGGSFYDTDLVLQSGEDVVLNVEFPAFSNVTGCVTDMNGNPAANVTVELHLVLYQDWYTTVPNSSTGCYCWV